MTGRRDKAVYGLLLAAWVLICAWQGIEHQRVKAAAREALTARARDISNSLGVVIRSQGRFGVVRYSRLQAALDELVKSQELQGVVLLNAEGETVASAVDSPDVDVDDLAKKEDEWGKDSVVFVNLVDLGSNAQEGVTTRSTTIILPPEGPDERGPGPRGPNDRDTTSALRGFRPPRRSDEGEHGREPRSPESGIERRGEHRDDRDTTSSPSLRERVREEFRRRGRRPGGLGRPPWMSEDQYKKLIAERGLHGFVLQMSVASYRAESARDMRLRIALAGLALAAVFGIGVGWNNLRRSSALELRLLRASDLNRHLKEMNVAAAGLAHETRNPLNIVRGLAQMIAQGPATGEEVRDNSRRIAEEVDRVTGRLNEFIAYSKPPVPRPAPTPLRAVAEEVERALGSDIADKAIQFAIAGPDLIVEADESLLRQVLFNLLINAIQAVSHGGRIEIRFETLSHGQGAFEVLDDGPGVPAGHEREIFQPYFTTRKEGTGLGLAVVRQIVLAHQWDVEYIRGESGITRFRVGGMKTA